MTRRYAFTKSLRLRSRADFSAVYDAKTRETRGPLVIYARPNQLAHPRLGLSTSRKVGTAAKRNRIRRLIREAFRHLQHDLPSGYDLLVVIRPHAPLTLAEYQKLMSAAVVKLHAVWAKRTSAGRPTENDGSGQ